MWNSGSRDRTVLGMLKTSAAGISTAGCWMSTGIKGATIRGSLAADVGDDPSIVIMWIGAAIAGGVAASDVVTATLASTGGSVAAGSSGTGTLDVGSSSSRSQPWECPAAVSDGAGADEVASGGRSAGTAGGGSETTGNAEADADESGGIVTGAVGDGLWGGNTGSVSRSSIGSSRIAETGCDGRGGSGRRLTPSGPATVLRGAGAVGGRGADGETCFESTTVCGFPGPGGRGDDIPRGGRSSSSDRRCRPVGALDSGGAPVRGMPDGGDGWTEREELGLYMRALS